MSWLRNGIAVICKADPEKNYKEHYHDIEKKIVADNYKPKTSMKNLISMVILHFDCDDNYGEYDPIPGCGGYGNEFSLEECFRYVEDSGGWKEFDWE